MVSVAARRQEDGLCQSPAEDLRSKAESKREFVQKFIRNLERAERQNTEEDRQWLHQVLRPQDPCFLTLAKLLVEPKYEGFVSLRCVVLRAIQMMLRFSVSMVASSGNPAAESANVGVLCFVELAGEPLARAAVSQVCAIAGGRWEDLLVCNALLVLAELGPDVVDPRLCLELVAIIERLPEREEELVEVALRMHSWGGPQREAIVEALVTHPHGSQVGAVLLTLINRGTPGRRVRAVKLVSGCIQHQRADRFVYPPDVPVLMEILLRELPESSPDESAFGSLAELYMALMHHYAEYRQHRRARLEEMLYELRCSELAVPDNVRRFCAQWLCTLRQAAGS